MQGIDVNLEGFQALAAVAGEPLRKTKINHFLTECTDDGRVNVNLQKPGKACATVEHLLHSMARHEETQSESNLDDSKQPPYLNIVIQIVGSRGDVQPFVALGLELQKFGHRVRIATHGSFRSFVENAGLEFFNIGGDPKEMMAYMVKNPGLLPHLKSIHEGDVEKSRKGIREILDGCWLSCFMTGENLDTPDNEQAVNAKPFVANAIIANPPSFAHIHCAEKLGVPLHMMFTYAVIHT